MKNSIYIIGAGDLGREIESWLEALPGFNENWIIKGFLDDNPEALAGKPSDYKVVGAPLKFNFDSNDYVIITITDPFVKQRFVASLRGKVNFFTYVAPSVLLGKYTKIGEGCIICSNCIISTNTVVGSFITINSGSQIGHDCVLEPYSSLMAHVDLGGYVKIGRCVFMGTKSTVIPSKTIGEKIVIGAGAVVIKNITKPGTYFGNPAKLIM